MIKKFIKISGTGKFLNYNHSNVPGNFRTNDFEKINLIYGENGSGKTTLSLILHSLQHSNDLLTKKRSFNKTFPQIIEVLTDVIGSPKFIYSSSKWNQYYPNIEIFDIHFINDNIYTALEIQSNHKKKLFEVIFGQPGILLKKDIQHIKERIQEGNKHIKETSKKIQLAIDNTFSTDFFSKMKPDSSIDEKILHKENEIITANSFQEIQQKPFLSSVPTLNLPFERELAIECLKKSIESISDTYLEKVNNHKAHIKISNAELWIKQGYEAIVDNSCPFCLRPFDKTVEIIEAYKQYFNNQYNQLLKSIASINLSIEAFNLEAQLLQITTKISSNNNLIEFWSSHLNNSPAQ